MKNITDEELVAAIEQRLKDKQQALGQSQDLLKQLKHLNNQLEAAEKMKTRFLSNIRNEINNPFGSILCLSENIMQLDAGQFEKVLSMASLIHREAFKLHFQLQNIFAAADLEAGEATLVATQVDIGSLVQHVLATFRPTIAQKSLCIKAHALPITEERLLFRTDAGKLKLILSNLLDNAINFSKPNETLEITWLLQDETLQMNVSDHGSGIQQKHQEVIFDRFTQLNASSTRLHGGHGLGLSIVKALLDMMGGRIEVDSVPRKGSVFVIAIPQLPTPDGEESFSDGNTLFFDSSDWQDEKH